MYLPSDTPILTQQRSDAAVHRAESDACVLATRRRAADGRARLFNTLISPGSVADSLGVGAAVNVAKLQQQTEESRASALLGGGMVGDFGPSVAEIMAGAPEVVSLNRGGGCQTQATYAPVPLGPDPVPSMPQRAPAIVPSPVGPMYYQGAPATQTYPSNALPMKFIPGPLATGPETPELSMKYMEILHTGMTGLAPAWADAGLVDGAPAGTAGGWLMENRWLVLGAAALGVLALSQRKGAR